VGGDWDIEVIQLADKLRQGEDIHLLDVREPHELEISSWRVPI